MGTQTAHALLGTRRWIQPLQGATAVWVPNTTKKTEALLDVKIVKPCNLLVGFSAETMV